VAKQPGIEHFYNGVLDVLKGVRDFRISKVDVDAKQGCTLSVQQTPPANPMTETTRIDNYLEHIQGDISLSAQIYPLCSQ
jgi:hypothetical protein